MPSFDALRSSLAGSVAVPGDGDFDQARQAWNLAVDQRPAVVAHASSADDVAAAIAFARSAGLRVAVQGSGHGASAMAPLDETLLLRTTRMDAISIDPDSRTARVEAGALWGPVADAAGEHGLAALHGSSIDVSVTGYTLGGGLGWLARSHGLACNSVTAIELVTADGEQRRVEGDDELFWALRGGGGSFGAVTALEFTLYPLREAYSGAIFWPSEAGAEVLHAYREWAEKVPETVTSIIRFLHLPPLPEVPEPLRDRPLMDLGVAFTGDPAEGEELMRPLREIATPVMEQFGVNPMPALARLHGDPEQPVPGLGDHALLRELAPATVDALVETAGHGSNSPLLGVELRQLGGALGRAPAGHGALAGIDGDYVLYGVGVPMGPPGRAEEIKQRLATLKEAVAPWASGLSYVNFADARGVNALPTAFDAETLDRLAAVKRAVDPDGLFQANHPVPVPG
jgi:FAD/FMN-containing dehydrogenase